MAAPPLVGLRVLEMGSRVMAPYVGKLFADAGADVCKLESPAGDPFRRWSASGAVIPEGPAGAASPWFSYLNGGKRSEVVDLASPAGRDRLLELMADVDVVLDDHDPADAVALGIDAATLRAAHPSVVVATLTRFGATGPWADRPANDFILQALLGSTELRGVPGEEPVSVGGDLGDFVGAAMAAPAVLAVTLAARASGQGAHVDASQYEAMAHCFQIHRQMFEVFDPGNRATRSIMIPSIEPATDGMVGLCCVTGQQWQDFCAMIGAPDLGEDDQLGDFIGRMGRRHEMWERIHAYTRTQTVDDLVELASAFRIPVGPVGTADALVAYDHLVEREVFRTQPGGHLAPRPAYRFSESVLEPPRPAPALGAGGSAPAAAPSEQVEVPRLGDDPKRPLAGIRILDLSTFWAGPVATNLLRVLGADLVKVESHVRLDGMRWASGLRRPLLWEWSPGYHGANVGKTVATVDLTTEQGMEVLARLVDEADVVFENFSPRVTENWGVTWDWIHQRNPRAVFLRAPAYGLDGPWRDRGGFAMTMEQVGGLANRTGHPDGPRLVPMGPVDYLAAMHSAFAVQLALLDRERTGLGQLVEMPLLEAALQASAEQVVEWSAHGNLLGPMGNRSPSASPQGLYPTAVADQWLAVSVETDAQWQALSAVVGGALSGLDRHGDVDALDGVIGGWSARLDGPEAADLLWRAGVPAAFCQHPGDVLHSPQLEARGFHHWKDHPATGRTPYPAFPFHVDGTHLPLGDPAPTLGQHTEEVLASVGFTGAEVAAMVEAGVSGDWPVGIPRD